MKLIIDRAALLKPLAHVQSVVEKRNTIPILSNVLLRAEGDLLSLTATDMDIDVVESVAADISQPGATTAPAHTLYDIVRKLPEGAQIELAEEPGSNRLTVRAGRSTFSLSTLSTEEFPALSGGELPYNFMLQATTVKALIDRTRFAISTEETRYYLNGIYLHATTSSGVPVMRAVATDGHRLARVEMPLPEGAAGMPGVIVPRKAVGELRKLVEDAEGEIGVSLSETKLRFNFGEIMLTTKLIDGTFPDYERVIPAGNDKTLQVSRKEFADAVDRVATISTEKSRAVKLSLQNGALILSATSPENGTAIEELEVSYTAAPIEIGFNSRYLLDITAQIEGDEAQFTLADSASPTIVRDQADESALYVLMPMRV
ncbi:MAG: DNA polymerase III subunit beta [Alphaproteobacteria bacterium]|nr:DNA polymerase III subunit beta [Alphaproteobacteria bacterium]MBU0798301.1 DNA polymerase III subunit beta [Alphaproteobacteria bacterium]MBU0886414.1 DNA polymerase III subunit beta [Alphaproteobacteria bacterium]MBU1813390.1 DNA polymerase III subunit beta [Alphaproteobacteria bacterium]MBU2092134.1 DNA polymerase III subunit beta [Alphaproteobacteria bacterium]